MQKKQLNLSLNKIVVGGSGRNQQLKVCKKYQYTFEATSTAKMLKNATKIEKNVFGTRILDVLFKIYKCNYSRQGKEKWDG